MENIFNKCCRNGNLDEIKEMYEAWNINIHANYDDAFRQSCYYGRLDVAQWLYSLGGVNIHAANDCAFAWSCYSDHLNVVQWLFSIDKFNNEVVDEYLPTQYHEYAFDQGYLPINNMVNTYAEYKNKIKNKIKTNNKIIIFELSYIVDIIVDYI